MWDDLGRPSKVDGPSVKYDASKDAMTRERTQPHGIDGPHGNTRKGPIVVLTILLSLLLIGSCLVFSITVAAHSVPGGAPLDRTGPGRTDLAGKELNGSGTGAPGYNDAMRFFIENKGQFDRDVRFVAVTEFGTAVFCDSKVQYCLELIEAGNRGSDLITLTFPGSESICPEGKELRPHYTNYFIGDESAWVSGARNFGSIVYHDIWPGIDLVYRFDASGLKYEFAVGPYVSENAIRVQIAGASIHADASCLTFDTGRGLLLDDGLMVSEEGGSQGLGAVFLAVEDLFTFQVEGRDPSKALLIDPLVYSTYFGGSDYDFSQSVTVDSDGNVYVTGQTQSVDFPKIGPFQGSLAGVSDAFVLKFDAEGRSLIYSTYIGGNGGDYGQDIAIDGTGNAYVVGSTNSTNFPTSNPAQTIYGGGNYDAFCFKLNPAGNAIAYSTYIGGSGEDVGNSLAVDGVGNAFVTGYTSSDDFPTSGPIQAAKGGSYDAFVLKLSVAGNDLIYSTYLGGGETDSGNQMVVDGNGNAYVTGSSYSTDFPTQNPYQANNAGSSDVFVLKLNPSGNALVFSTYIGGGLTDHGQGIAIDIDGKIYVVGYTESSNFPTTVGSFQTIGAGGGDTFVVKLNPSGDGLVYSTYFGGGNEDVGMGIALDAMGGAYITGYTSSTDLPTLSPFQSSYGGDLCDAYVFKLDPTGKFLLLSTYFGGTDTDAAYGIALDPNGNIYLSGGSYSTDFPTFNAFQPGNSGDCDGFILKFDLKGSASLYSTYAGGSDEEQGEAIALDANGNVYIVGQTHSPNFPISSGSFRPNYEGEADVFILKLDPSGSALIYSTYVGGSWDDQGIDIAVDAAGNAYVTGYTYSQDFPTSSPIQAANGGYYDAFALKLNPAGNALVYSTYVGGEDTDFALGIAIDDAGNAYITGGTYSLEFPTASPLIASNSGGCDIFVLKLNAAGNAFVYSTFIGGGLDDEGMDIAIDDMGNAYVTGDTNSTDFFTANPLQAANGGDYDAFVLKLNVAGSVLIFSTYIGGSGEDYGKGIDLDDFGNAYVTGDTNSTDFPTTINFQSEKGELSDAFVLKMDPAGRTLIYSTFIGGDDVDIGYHIAVDEGGNANVVGYTHSIDFPVASPMQAVNAGYYDAFVLKLNPLGNMLVYSTYIGGSDSDYGLSIAIDASGNAYVTGGTYSMDFPIADPFQASNGGDEDIFLLKLGSFAAPSEPLALTAVPGDGHVILSWSAPNDDGGALVDYYIVFKDGSDVAHPIATSFDITGLTNGVAYTFAVAAHNSLGVGPTTPTIDATPSTDMVLPGVPTLLELTAGDSRVTISWGPPASGGTGIDYYVIYRNGVDVKHSTELTTEMVGLTNGVEYSFVVAAHNAAGTGPETAVEHATPKASAADGSGGLDLTIILAVVAAIVVVLLVAIFMVRRKKPTAPVAPMPPRPGEPVPLSMPVAPIPPPAEVTKYCPWCGERAGEEFCGNCGRKVS